jgi:hypothetical protein
MDTPQARQAEEQTNLFGFLFFMMGALHIYGQFRAKSKQINLTTRLFREQLWKVGLLSAIIAGMLEVLIN